VINQPTPEVSKHDIERLIRRDFSEKDVEEVYAILSKIEVEKFRVCAAALKLSNGSLAKLKCNVNSDYRDLLACAEYPNYMKKVRSFEKNPSENTKRIFALDWQQYQNWFNAK